MSSKAIKQPLVPPFVASALEVLRSHIVELEAVAHAAEDALQHLPYVPRPEPGEEQAQYTDKQLGPGRLHTMVSATSSATRMLLKELDRLLEVVQAPGKPRYSSGTGSSRASEDWNLEYLLLPRLGSLTEPS